MRQMDKGSLRLLFPVIFCLLFLAGCGGGGGSSSEPQQELPSTNDVIFAEVTGTESPIIAIEKSGGPGLYFGIFIGGETGLIDKGF